MKTLCARLLLILFGFSVSGYAVSSLQINSLSAPVFTNDPGEVAIQCELSSPGERVDIEFYIDVNNNNLVDDRDFRFDMLSLVDGIGWIRDGEAPENDIPGDEAAAEGFITTTLSITRENRPSGSQNWILRATDAGQSSAITTIRWNLAQNKPSVYGTVTDNYTKAPLPGTLLFARDNDFPDVLYTTITDELGNYRFSLAPGDWKIYANKASDTLQVNLTPAKSIQKHLPVNPLASFITGKVTFEDGAPVPGFVITAQNTELMEFYSAGSDENGNFVLNVAPGAIEISCSPALAKMFGNTAWPEGYYASTEYKSLIVKKGQPAALDIQLIKYPMTLQGACRVNGVGLADVLVQGTARNAGDGKMQFFQTYTRMDGSFSLGVLGANLVSLVAQKPGYVLHPETGYTNIDMTKNPSLPNYNFAFSEEKPLMTISGTIYNDDLTLAQNVPVIAYNKWEKSGNGYMIQMTNSRGEFCFHPRVEGSWQIGLYKKDYKSIPPLHYLYVNEGMAYTDIKFFLYLENDSARFEEGHFKPAALNIIPNQPLPFEPVTSIQFVLPEARRTRVQLLDMAGNPLRTLVNEKLSGGKHTIAWDGADSNGNLLSSGIYLCRIDAVNESIQQTITLLR